MTTGLVYLIHLDQPFTSQRRVIQHYLGSTCKSIEERMTRHITGNGAKLLMYCNQRGITYHVVRIWESQDIRQMEIDLKRARHHARLCPVCNPKMSEFRTNLPDSSPVPF